MNWNQPATRCASLGLASRVPPILVPPPEWPDPSDLESAEQALTKRRNGELSRYLLLLLLLIIGSFFLLLCGSSFGSETTTTPARTMEVTVFVQADVQKYKELINDTDFEAAAELPFVKKKVVVPYSTDVIRASADAAAKEMPTRGGPTIIYLKIEKGTAYVRLNIDRDGWAGVGFSLARSHPVIEKTLFQFKNIERVVWDEAPGEKRLHDR